MNRLTERGKSGIAYTKIPLNNSTALDENENIIECYTGFIAEKLAEYEDLEEQGLLIKLPCKVDDFVFEANINRNIVSSYIVTAIVVGKNSRNYKWGLLDGIYSNMNGFNEFALGKSVFLTREEAEKALEATNGE